MLAIFTATVKYIQYSSMSDPLHSKDRANDEPDGLRGEEGEKMAFVN